MDGRTGLLSYVAGTPNRTGSSGDGGLATAALVNTTMGIAFDPSGNLYFSDSKNFVVRRIDAVTGMITTVAGNAGGSEDEGYVGPPTGTFLVPGQLAFDSAGNLYLSDSVNRFPGVRRIDAATNIMTTIAGVDRPGPTGFSKGATDLFNVVGFALDSVGNLITYTQGIDNHGQGVSAIFKVDTTTSLISLPYTNDGDSGTAPYVGSAYTHATNETVNVTNIGNAPLTLFAPPNGSTPTVTGPALKLDDPATSGCPVLTSASPNFTLAAGTSCFLAVDFTPIVVGLNPGAITLTDNSLNTTATVQTVTLAGYAQAAPGPALLLTPATVTFPNTQVGGASGSQTITVTNNGTADATSLVVTLLGANAGSFT